MSAQRAERLELRTTSEVPLDVTPRPHQALAVVFPSAKVERIGHREELLLGGHSSTIRGN